MNTHADKTQENKSQSVANEVSQEQSGGKSTFQFVDNRPESVAQRKLQEMANNSAQMGQLKAFQEMTNNSPQAKQTAQLQAMADNYSAQQPQLIQKKENNTGLPDNLKSGIENLSGYSMDDIKVHRNSDKPAQLQAHAYAQGNDIHLGPGQEKHLPHEAWHVVQQKQGRVKPTMQMKGGVNINYDTGLEKEADVMGRKAQLSENNDDLIKAPTNLLQKKNDRRNPRQLMATYTPNALSIRNQYLDAQQKKKSPDYIKQLELQMIDENQVTDETGAISANDEGASSAQGIVLDSTTIHQLYSQAFQNLGGSAAHQSSGLYIFSDSAGYHISISLNSFAFHITRNSDGSHVYWSQDNEYKEDNRTVQDKVTAARTKINQIRQEFERLNEVEQKRIQSQKKDKQRAMLKIESTNQKSSLALSLNLNADDNSELLAQAIKRGWNIEALEEAKENKQIVTNRPQDVLQLRQKVDSSPNFVIQKHEDSTNLQLPNNAEGTEHQKHTSLRSTKLSTPVVQRILIKADSLSTFLEFGAQNSSFNNAMNRCYQLPTEIRIVISDTKVSPGSVATFIPEGDLGTVYIRTHQSLVKILNTKDVNMIKYTVLANLSHELTHAADWAETKLESKNTLGEGEADYDGHSEKLMRTEWRAWAIEAATAGQFISNEKNVSNQALGIFSSFNMPDGIVAASGGPTTVFYQLSQQYLNQNAKNFAYEEMNFNPKNIASFFGNSKVQKWMQEAQAIFDKAYNNV